MTDIGGWWFVWGADGETIKETRSPEVAARVARTDPRAATVEDRSTGLEWHWDGGAWHPVEHSEPPPFQAGGSEPGPAAPSDGPPSAA